MYRLIIADDEESIRNGIAHSLPWREWGYEVCALCSDGQEVLEQLKLVHPDVVLSDTRMPGMDGVELMQRLSSAYPDVKIVILSGYSDRVLFPARKAPFISGRSKTRSSKSPFILTPKKLKNPCWRRITIRCAPRSTGCFCCRARHSWTTRP